MILASPSFFQNLIWISNAQHIIPFLFILLMIYCEILWNQNKKRSYKVLALFAFVLGLFSNFTSFIAIPLVCLVHLFFLRPEENRFQIGYYLRILFALSPYLILLAAFYWFYSGTVAYKNYQMLVQDETHPYYAIFTVAQAFRNLEKIVKYIFPARGLILLLVPLIMIFSIVVFVKNFLTKKKQNNQVKMNIFFILWFLISIFMFLFFKGRRPENLFFLGSIGIYFLLITNVIGFILQRGMSEKNKKICINIILIFILGTHCFYSYKRGSPENHNIRIGGFGGQKNEKAIRQIRYLVDFYLEGKKVIYLVSYERYVSKAEDFVDHTLIFLGYGTFAKVFFKDMNIVFEFVLENIEERIRGIKEDEALIFYDGNCNFFLRPLPALDS